MHIQTGSDHMMNRDGFALRSNHRIRKILIQDGMSFLGICLSVAGLSVVGYQSLLWIKFGSWSPLAFRLVLELIGAREPLFAWQSAAKVSAWICDLPLSGVLFAAGLAVICSVAVTTGGRPSGAA
jgi:hypothetical protein